MSENAADRVRAYLTARAQDISEQEDVFRTQGIIARCGEHYLTEIDLEVLLQTLDLVARIAAQGDLSLHTEQELTDAPQGTVLLSEQDQVWQKVTEFSWMEPGSAIAHPSQDIALPARIIT